ncbi:flavin-binding monooxygenase-like protein [Phycomyces nitens]|nr:flavin-binding monooxygenase-like protein [Phycomyces nitens]
MSPTVGIIGSGVSGICAAIQVKKHIGVTAKIFEGASDMGGTWNQNTYPGCACDVDSHLYSFSFAMNPNWSRKYSPSAEIKEYVIDVAKRFDVYKDIQYNTTVVSATWSEELQKWKLDWVQNNQPVQSSYFDYIFSALGSLRIPRVPEIFKGFEGTIVHTGAWDSSIDFTNKRVAVIGTGSSAVQAIPQLVKTVASLESYQRSSAWVLDSKQIVYPSWVKTMFIYLPFIMYLYRLYIYYSWERLYYLFGYPDSTISKLKNQSIRNSMIKRLEAQGRGDLIPVLIPDYIIGCKRILPSESYLEAMCDKKVRVNRSPIREIVGRTIFTEDGQSSEFDILCLATGFDVSGFLGDLRITGRNNVCLNELWETEYTKTYKSVGIHGFPNFFMLGGPASLLGNNSIIFMAEQQVKLAIRSIKYALKNKFVAMEPTVEAQDKFTDKLRADLKGTAWDSGCNNWYKNKKGELTALWSGPSFLFLCKLYNTNFDKDYIHYSS